MGNPCNHRADLRPHILVEGGMEYCLGNFDGKRIEYDFSKVITYLDAKGRSLFGENFKVRGEDKGTFLKLCSYMVKDSENCRKMEIDTNKGILLTGPVGCGKTSMMRLIRHIVPHQRTYEIIPARNITFAFNHIGYKIIEDYGNGRFYCFDDLGVEPMGRYFGDDCNVMGGVGLTPRAVPTDKDPYAHYHKPECGRIGGPLWKTCPKPYAPNVQSDFF